MNEQLAFVKEIARRLDSAGIPYMLTGSTALALYARPRMTRDIDLVIECAPRDSDAIVRLFEPDCYVDAESVRNAVAARSMFNIIHNKWIVKADFIVRKEEPYRKVEFGRRRRLHIEDFSVWVAAPEDLILSKLLWAKDAPSRRQLDDVRAIVQSAQDLDWAYLEKWAAELGVKNLLSEARGS